MIFAISPGSDGSGPERYIAYLPFVLAPGANLASMDGPVTSTQGTFSLKLEQLHHYYTLSSGPFASEEAAVAHFDQLRACLLWLSLRHGVGISYSKILGNLNLLDLPRPVPDSGPFSHVAGTVGWTATDGSYNADKALIIPNHKRLIRWENGRASVVTGISIESFFKSLSEALSFESPGEVIENDKLRLAIELYAAYRFELSSNAQLITLVSALESLLPRIEEIPAGSKVALKQAKKAVKASRDRHAQDSTEWGVINRLLCRVGELKHEAIGTTLRNYVASVVSRHPELGDPEDVRSKLRNLYSIRSKLLHEGHPGEEKIEPHLSFARDFVPRLLAALFREAAKAFTR